MKIILTMSWDEANLVRNILRERASVMHDEALKLQATKDHALHESFLDFYNSAEGLYRIASQLE